MIGMRSMGMRGGLALAVTVMLAACGGGGSPDLVEDWERHVAEDRAEPAAPSEPRPDEIVDPSEIEPAPDGAPFEGTAGEVREAAEVSGVAVQRDLRAARNEGFDRVVFEFEDVLPGYEVAYVDQPVRECGSGEVVPIEGDGWLRVRFEPARAHEIAGEEARVTVSDRARRLDLPVATEAHVTCDYEAVLEWVVGVRSPNRYRVLELREPARLVVDILHD
jgi:hypothetical protein